MWRLSSVSVAHGHCKSLILAAALLHGEVAPGDAAEITRLEEEYQAQQVTYCIDV